MIDTSFDAPDAPLELERPTSPDPERERRLAILEPYITERRQSRLEWALRHRVEGLCVVLDSVVNLGNASAVMRTCDGFGVHHVHLIEDIKAYKRSRRVATGSHKWLQIHRYHSAAPCIARLREEGYRIAVTSFDTDTTLEDLDASGKLAVVLGGEMEGVGPEMLEAADTHFRLEMYGLAQSFNVSVAASLCVAELTRRRRMSQPGPFYGDLPPASLDALRESFYRRGVGHAEAILKRELGHAPPPPPVALGTTLEL